MTDPGKIFLVEQKYFMVAISNSYHGIRLVNCPNPEGEVQGRGQLSL